MRRHVEDQRTPISTKRSFISIEERKKILNQLCIFGSPTSSITDRYDAADYLHAEFSIKMMPLSILMKSIDLITGIYLPQDEAVAGGDASNKLLIWPATKILQGIALKQNDSKVLNVIICDLIPVICNSLLSRIEIPSPEFEMVLTFLSSFAYKNSAARHKIRTTSFPSILIELMGTRQITVNEHIHSGTLLSLMEEHDEEFDNVVTDQEMLFRVFEDLLIPSNEPIVLKAAFLIFAFYFTRKVPRRIEKLVENKQILANIINFLPEPLVPESTRLECLRSLLYIHTLNIPNLPGLYLENGFIEKFTVAWNFIHRQDQIWYLSSFMAFSNEFRNGFFKDGKVLSDLIVACYGNDHKDVDASVSCIYQLLKTLPEPLRTDFALSGAHDAIQHNTNRLPTIISISDYSTDTNNVNKKRMIRYTEDNNDDDKDDC